MQVYKSLADCYFQPDEKLYPAVQQLVDSLQDLEPELAEHARTMQQDLLKRRDDLLELTKEYSRLLVGPYELQAPPFGSIYFQHKSRQARLMDDSTRDVEEIYRKAGVNLDREFNSPPDHISAELEFMYYLLYHEHASREAGDENQAMDWHTQRTHFMQKHLGLWGPLFADTLTRNADSPFYHELGRLTKAFIVKDKIDMKVMRPPG
ncbi:molecular chaperone TorD family protein [Desulfonatronospira sp.]|uniref:TorD/DmsD family molecular chaperone n=1 Tax=Desulfonatronospira sp. TaxID=1962951 RepID=UPI0025C5D7E8|nr:molecular chaperone TorD family protein [Desulfonatronospira sp.]